MSGTARRTGRPPVVTWTGVSRVYEGAVDVCALRPTELEIQRGDYVAITGPSGAGKSTMLNLLGLLDSPTSGTYQLEGSDVSALDEAGRAAVRAQLVGFVFQSFHLIDRRSVGENVELGMLYTRRSRAQRAANLHAALSRVGMVDRIDDTPARLSGGERQRVAIARAVAAQPALLLCDEPTGNLDTVSSNNVMACFESLLVHGDATLVVVTHDEEVAQRAERVLRVRDGWVSEQ